jgi:hypothetical protein
MEKKCKHCNKITKWVIKGFEGHNRRYVCLECRRIEEDYKNE